MAGLKRVVIVLLVITLIFSAVSVVFNLVIYNLNSEKVSSRISASSNLGNVGFIVEENNFNGVQSENGG